MSPTAIRVIPVLLTEHEIVVNAGGMIGTEKIVRVADIPVQTRSCSLGNPDGRHDPYNRIQSASAVNVPV